MNTSHFRLTRSRSEPFLDAGNDTASLAGSRASRPSWRRVTPSPVAVSSHGRLLRDGRHLTKVHMCGNYLFMGSLAILGIGVYFFINVLILGYLCFVSRCLEQEHIEVGNAMHTYCFLHHCYCNVCIWNQFLHPFSHPTSEAPFLHWIACPEDRVEEREGARAQRSAGSSGPPLGGADDGHESWADPLTGEGVGKGGGERK